MKILVFVRCDLVPYTYRSHKASLSVSFLIKNGTHKKVKPVLPYIDEWNAAKKVGSNSSTKVNLKLFKPFIVNHDLLLYI